MEKVKWSFESRPNGVFRFRYFWKMVKFGVAVTSGKGGEDEILKYFFSSVVKLLFDLVLLSAAAISYSSWCLLCCS